MKIYLTAFLALLCITGSVLLSPVAALANDEVIVPHDGVHTTSQDPGAGEENTSDSN